MTNSVDHLHDLGAFEVWMHAAPEHLFSDRTDFIFIDEAYLFTNIERFSSGKRTISGPNAQKNMRRLISRFANRLYKSLEQPETDRVVFREGIAFLLETEMFWHLPVRHFARSLVRNCDREKKFAVVIKSANPRFGLMWTKSELWPLYIGYELSRLGRTVVFCLSDDRAIDAITIGPGDSIVRKPYTTVQKIMNGLIRFCPYRRVVSSATIRDGERAIKQLRPFVHLPSGLEGRSADLFQLDIRPIRQDFGDVRLPLKEITTKDCGTRVYRGAWRASGVVRPIIEEVDRVLASAYRTSEAFVARHRITRFDTADHLTLEAGVFAVAVHRKGGEVRLWPHASNPINVGYRAPFFVHVSAATEVCASAWRQHYPQADVTVYSGDVFPEFTLDQAHDGSRRVTLVMFGVRAFLGALPRCNIKEHTASLKELVQLTAEHPSIELIYKSKDKADAQAFRQKIDPEGVIKITDARFSSMDWPNMVFSSPTLISTAILEGICMGIPATLLRATPAWNHVPISDEVITIADAPELVAHLEALCDPKTYFRTAKSQELWLRSILCHQPQPDHSASS
jgi:hypothetical protein